MQSFFDSDKGIWITEHLVNSYTFQCTGASQAQSEERMDHILLFSGGDPEIHKEAMERGRILNDLLARGLEIGDDEDF